MGLFLVGVACGFLALVLGGRGSGRASLVALLLAYGAPAAFVAHTLASSHGQVEHYRFALLGLGFRAPADGGELRLTLGGDRESHDVWISALGEGTSSGSTLLGHLVFEPPGGAAFDPAPEPATGLLGLRRPGRPIRPYRAVELYHGDRLLLGERAFEVELGGGAPAVLRSAGAPADIVVELPRRLAGLPLGLAVEVRRPLGAAVETYPLAWLETAALEDGDAGVLHGSSGFLFWEADGLLGRRLWVAASDPSIAVERGGTVPPGGSRGEIASVAFPARSALPGDVALHVLSPPRWDGVSQRAGGLRDRRSFRLRGGERSLALTFETPEIYVLPRAAVLELAADSAAEPAGGEAGPPLRLHLALGGWQITDRSLYFRHASRKVALEALSTLGLPRRLADGPFGPAGSFRVSTPWGERQVRLGEAVWLGKDHLAAVRLDVLRPPLALAVVVAVLALLKVAAAFAARLAAVHVLLLAPLEALAALRLLVGYRAWVMPPFSQEAFELALVAWALVPWVFLLVAIPVPRGRPFEVAAALPAWGGGIFAAAWCAAFGGGLRGGAFLAVLAGAAALGAARALDLGPWLAERWRPRTSLFGESERRDLLLWTAAAFLPTLLRLVLLVFGYRESLLVGGERIALTLLHLPLGILLEAGYLLWLRRRLVERGGITAQELVPGLALLAGTWALPALVVGDLGLALLNVPVFLLAWGSLTFAARRQAAVDGSAFEERWWSDRGFWVHAAPAVVLGVYLVLAAFPLGARALLAVIPEETALELESERNYLRLLGFAYPESLEKVARRSSEELAVMSAVMRSYTSGPWDGRGYFGSEISPHIAPTALREHAPAVFVAAEWGLAGTFGLVLCFAVALRAGLVAAPWRHEASSRSELPDGVWWSGAAASIAALTLGIASLYMILANYRLTLFTGKNVYLLGLDSTADVLEASLLAAVFALGVAVVRDDEEE